MFRKVGTIASKGRRFALVALLASGGLSALEATKEPLRLEAQRPVERRIAKGETQLYEVSVEQSEVIRLIVVRRGIDIDIEISCPGAAPQKTFGYGSFATTVSVAIVESSGTCRVALQARDVGSGDSYRMTLETKRSPDAVDRLRAEAARIIAGYDWNREKTAEERAQVIRQLESAVSVWRQVGDKRGLAVDLTYLGFERFYSGKPKEALAAHEEALELWGQLKDRAGQVVSSNAIGMALSYMANYPRAIQSYDRAVELASQLPDPFEQARALSNMSIAYRATGDYEKARDCLERALPLRRAAHDRRGEAFTLQGMGDIASAVGDRRRALELWLQTAEMAEETRTNFLLSDVLTSIGMAQAEESQYDKALVTLKRARQLQKDLGWTRLEGRTVSLLGRVEADLRHPKDALALQEEALALAQKAQDRPGQAMVLQRMARAQALNGDLMRARESCVRSRETWRAVASPNGEIRALVDLVRIERQLGERSDARSHLDEALDLVETRRQKVVRAEERAAYTAAWQDAYRISAELFLEDHAKSPRSGFDLKAFHETERSRARGLLESVVEARLDLSADIPEDLRQREEALSASLSALQKKLASDEAARKQTEEEISKGEQEWSRLAVEIRNRSPRYASIRYPESISAEVGRAILDPETAVVSYLLGEEHSYVFVLTADRLSVETISARVSELSEWVEAYVGLLAGKNPAGFEELALRISAALLDPWLKSLAPSIRRLVIVPSGVLYSLPFETLRLPASGPLLERYSVSYVPSLTVLAALADPNREPAASGVLAFGAPQIPASLAAGRASLDGQRVDLGPLPFAEVEARAVARYGGAESRLYLGPQASEKRFKGMGAERFAVLHFATHALLSRAFPSRSALVLAAESDDPEDGLLQAREIYSLHLNSELVVLSACRTAGGKILPGEGVQGLAQSFFHAGARSLVASLWDVSDRRTADLMTRFYSHLADGEPKSEALRSAKLDLLRREPGLAPRFWAGFVLIGEPWRKVPLRKAS